MSARRRPAWNGDEPAEDCELVLVRGGLGQLAAEVRRALVVILKRRYVSAERDPDVWRILVENRIALETRLNDMFLQLIVDRDYGVAYKRQADAGRRRDVPDSAAQPRPTAGSRPFSWSICVACSAAGSATAMKPSSWTARSWSTRSRTTGPAARPTRWTRNARPSERSKRCAKSDILLQTPEPGRYRISPIIEVLLPVRQVAGTSRVPQPVQYGRPPAMNAGGKRRPVRGRGTGHDSDRASCPGRAVSSRTRTRRRSGSPSRCNW